MSTQMMWWAYLHANGTVQVKRWFGDVKDYTTDCEGNDFVVQVVRPFRADDKNDAEHAAAAFLLAALPEKRAKLPAVMIDSSHRDEATCPYCGWHDRDSWELFRSSTDGDGATTETECGRCEQTFIVTLNVTRTYSTEKKQTEQTKETEG